MMSINVNTIAKALINELFNAGYKIGCGPEQKYDSYHKRVQYGLSRSIPSLPYITPDNFYKPRIVIGFDFLGKFASGLTSEKGFVAARPVSEDTLYRVGAELTSFFEYYFEYVMTYGKNTKKSELLQLVNWDAGAYEGDLQLFINVLLNFFFSSVNTDQAINSIGSCSIMINDNKNYIMGQKLNLFFDKTFGILNQILVPMVPVMVWATGRLYKDWYFPIFDGYITSVVPSERPEQNELVIECRDSLELARISTEMINPSIIQIKEIQKQSNINIFSQPLYGIDHKTIFKTLFHGGQLVYDPQAETRVFSFASGQPTGRKDALNFSALGKFKRASFDIDGSSINPNGLSDDNCGVRKSEMGDGYISIIKKVVDYTSHEKRQRYTSTWGDSITPYRVYQTNSPQVFNAEFSSRLEILENIAQMVYYNFYIDGFGTVHYHPMRLANNFLQYDIIERISIGSLSRRSQHKYPFPGTQILGPEEITSTSSRVNVEELKTFLRLTGQDPTITEAAQELLDLVGSATDEHNMSRFGYRRKSVNNRLFNRNVLIPGSNGKTASLMDMIAKSLLQYFNSELYTTQSSIVFRPEMKLAAPIFYVHDHTVFYANSISHSASINGDASTNVGGNFGRQEKEMPPNLSSFILMSDILFKNNNTVPPLSRYASFAEVQGYYNKYFSINEAPFVEWLDRQMQSQKQFDDYENQKSKDRYGP